MKAINQKITSRVVIKKGDSGHFVIGANRGKSAVGYLDSTEPNKLVFKLVNNNYSPYYLRSKIRGFIDSNYDTAYEFDIYDLSEDELMNENLIIARGSTGNNLELGKDYTIDEPLENFLIEGVIECMGIDVDIPIDVRYAGQFPTVCDGGGEVKEYSKYIII